MNLEVGPIIADDPARTEFLRNHVREKFNDAVKAVREFIPTLPSDPWKDFWGLMVVWIHEGNVPYNGGFVSGLHSGGEFYRGFRQREAYSRIDINWDDEYTEKRFTLQHEIQNMLNFHSGTNPNLGYGTSDDPAIVMTKAKLDRLYHGDVQMYHLRNADQDL